MNKELDRPQFDTYRPLKYRALDHLYRFSSNHPYISIMLIFLTLNLGLKGLSSCTDYSKRVLMQETEEIRRNPPSIDTLFSIKKKD